MKLTDNLLRKLPAPEQGNKITYDDAVKGFGVRVTAADGRAFILNYRRKLDGRERRYTIGNYPDWSTTAAREEAKRLKRLVDGGADPLASRRRAEPRPPLRTCAPASSATTFHANGHPRSGSIGSRSTPTFCPPLAGPRLRPYHTATSTASTIG